jgi:hypothetical protein
MALLLRFSPSERALRSVDESPGILCLMADDEGVLSFAVESRIPPTIPSDAVGVMARRHGGECTLTVAEAIEACETPRELRCLLQLAVGVVQVTSLQALPLLSFESIAAACEFGIDVRDHVDEALRALGEPDGIGGGEPQ